MMQVLRSLEPRFFKKKTNIIDEFDEMLEVLFLDRGEILVGYEINKQKRYCLKFTNKCIIGAFGCTFNQRAAFIYTSLTESSGFAIRKHNWKDILDSSEEMARIVRKNVLMEYLT